jgi:hypothetical protein
MCSLCYSLRKSVPGTQTRRTRRWSPVRHEGTQKSHHCAEKEDHGAYKNRETSSRSGATISLPCHVALRFPDRRQIASHTW